MVHKKFDNLPGLSVSFIKCFVISTVHFLLQLSGLVSRNTVKQQTKHYDIVTLKFINSFSSTMYTSLGAILIPKVDIYGVLVYSAENPVYH